MLINTTGFTKIIRLRFGGVNKTVQAISGNYFSRLCLCLYTLILLFDYSYIVPVVHKSVIEKIVINILLTT